jgi:putative membrane protein
MALDPGEARTINERIGEIEARTGVRIATSIVARCDAYVELPWKAFALGAGLAGLATVLAALFAPDRVPHAALLRQVVAILGAGASSALAAVWIPAWAHVFLRPSRRDLEVRQYAQALFLQRELFATPQRTGVLILVCRFERKVQILPDTGFRDRIATAEWRTVIKRMTPSLGQGHPHRALQEGLGAMEELLLRKGFVAPGASESEATP